MYTNPTQLLLQTTLNAKINTYIQNTCINYELCFKIQEFVATEGDIFSWVTTLVTVVIVSIQKLRQVHKFKTELGKKGPQA